MPESFVSVAVRSGLAVRGAGILRALNIPSAGPGKWKVTLRDGSAQGRVLKMFSGAGRSDALTFEFPDGNSFENGLYIAFEGDVRIAEFEAFTDEEQVFPVQPPNKAKVRQLAEEMERKAAAVTRKVTMETSPKTAGPLPPRGPHRPTIGRR